LLLHPADIYTSLRSRAHGGVGIVDGAKQTLGRTHAPTKKRKTGAAPRIKRSIFHGVSLDHGRWVGRVYFEGTQYKTKSFSNEIDAAEAYDALARSLRGDKAKLNFPAGDHEAHHHHGEA
jgi:hypothetical protein